MTSEQIIYFLTIWAASGAVLFFIIGKPAQSIGYFALGSVTIVSGPLIWCLGLLMVWIKSRKLKNYREEVSAVRLADRHFESWWAREGREIESKEDAAKAAWQSGVYFGAVGMGEENKS